MAKVIMTCGRLCCGKSTYARSLAAERGALILSIDELMLSMLDRELGDMHEVYVDRAERYLYAKSVELVGLGVDVILDWGFWTAESRRYARDFYAGHGIDCELHYIEIADDEWQRRIAKRNALVLAGSSNDYYVDDNLAAKFRSMFEPPSKDETDVRVC